MNPVLVAFLSVRVEISKEGQASRPVQIRIVHVRLRRRGGGLGAVASGGGGDERVERSTAGDHSLRRLATAVTQQQRPRCGTQHADT